MKLKVLSDTHGFHSQEPLDEVDLLIHCGDAANSGVLWENEIEFLNFWLWWENYPAKYKVFVPGNHSKFIASKESKILRKSLKPNCWILIDQTIIIEGCKIFGSPFTPTFGNWSFMANRSKIHKHWELIEENTDIVITHGPPKSILDLTFDTKGKLEFCGDSSLLRIIYKIKPAYHLFGHVHGEKQFENNGILERKGIKFVNCSQVRDNMFDHGLMYNGKIFHI